MGRSSTLDPKKRGRVRGKHSRGELGAQVARHRGQRERDAERIGRNKCPDCHIKLLWKSAGTDSSWWYQECTRCKSTWAYMRVDPATERTRKPPKKNRTKAQRKNAQRRRARARKKKSSGLGIVDIGDHHARKRGEVV